MKDNKHVIHMKEKVKSLTETARNEERPEEVFVYKTTKGNR